MNAPMSPDPQKFGVILVAAGKGSRFAAMQNAPGQSSTVSTTGLEKKPFVPLAGQAIFLHSVERFAAHPAVAQIILVVSEEDYANVTERFATEIAHYRLNVVIGGAHRSDSVERGVAAVRSDIEFLAIHDAARPLISPSVMAKVFDAAIRYGGAICASRLVGTIKHCAVQHGTVDSSQEMPFVTATVPRNDLWEAQTPQAFRRDLYERSLSERGDFCPTDDASLFERMNFPVAVVESPRTNLKITTADDLLLAEQLLLAAREKPE